MKTLLLALLAAFAPLFVSAQQEVAVTVTHPTEYADAATPASDFASSTPNTSNPAPVATVATAQLNGVTVQMQALPATSTVLISFSMPPQQGWAALELADARTGEVVYSGSVLVNEGQLELPVPVANQPYEARLSTDHDVVIARMAQ
jgi:hypothetical protein